MAGGYEVELLQRDECGADTVTVRFEKPGGYSFKPGQWFTLRLKTAEGLITETFSHASAPSDPFVELTTRITGSPFKRALVALEQGQHAHLNGPGGRFFIGDEVERIAFLVGGVGVTPVRSILRDAEQRGRVFADALLLYGNRDESCVPYRTEFEEIGDIGLRVVIVYEQPPKGWTGEVGFITAETVRRHVDVADGRPFVVTGPPIMVTVMEGVLDQLEMPLERRRVERFS